MSARTVFLAVIATTAVLCALGAQAEYTADAAMSALQFAKASYCDADAIRNWTCASCAAHPSFSQLSVYGNKSAGTQAYIGVDNGRVVVAFRGSQNTKNWEKNLDVARTAYSNPNCKGCKVHSGFLKSYASLKTELLQKVQELVKAHSSKSILVTGHSLGGAMATLAAADIAQLQYPSDAKPHVDLYTFGSPRLGNQDFAKWFANLFYSEGHASYRVTHKRDIVPHVPASFTGFVHVSREYWYDNDKNADWKVCNDVSGSNSTDQKVNEDGQCSNSFALFNVQDHLMYLGVCTSCSCDEEVVKAARIAHPSAQLKSMLAADYVYMHTQRKN